MNISERLKIVRGDLTQAEFSTMLGLHKNTLGRYERGDSSPDSEFCAKVCSVFGVSPAWLLLGIGTMEEERSSSRASNEFKNTQNETFLSQFSDSSTAKLEQELELEKTERRELAMENRKLYREKEALLRENGELREKIARLEAERGRQRSDLDEGDFPPLFDEQRATPSSSRPTVIRK